VYYRIVAKAACTNTVTACYTSTLLATMQPVHGQVRPPTAVSAPLAAASSSHSTPTTVNTANTTAPAAPVAARVPRTLHTAAAAVAPPVETHQVPHAQASQSVNASHNAISRETSANNGPFHAAHATEQAVAEVCNCTRHTCYTPHYPYHYYSKAL
jgi:hypothetical protein